MNRPGTDPKVKKTLVRNCEQKIRLSSRPRVVHQVESCSRGDLMKAGLQEPELSSPTLCSSEALANYLSDVKKSLPPSSSAEDLNFDREQISSKMTKKLNFHMNDRIYKNLIELNTSIEQMKTKKERRPHSAVSKKDLEPNIEDFCDDEKEPDTPPTLTAVKQTFRAVRRVENGDLHKLVAAFELL